MGARRAGPASDSRKFGAGFLIVAGTGIPDLALASGSVRGCMTDRRLESMVARQDSRMFKLCVTDASVTVLVFVLARDLPESICSFRVHLRKSHDLRGKCFLNHTHILSFLLKLLKFSLEAKCLFFVSFLEALSQHNPPLISLMRRELH